MRSTAVQQPLHDIDTARKYNAWSLSTTLSLFSDYHGGSISPDSVGSKASLAHTGSVAISKASLTHTGSVAISKASLTHTGGVAISKASLLVDVGQLVFGQLVCVFVVVNRVPLFDFVVFAFVSNNLNHSRLNDYSFESWPSLCKDGVRGSRLNLVTTLQCLRQALQAVRYVVQLLGSVLLTAGLVKGAANTESANADKKSNLPPSMVAYESVRSLTLSVGD
jgi:hypothetical protein